MSAIAYITDSKLLELHRLNTHKTMNFWRLTSNVAFSDFRVGDLLFFLSKDKEHMNQGEKGIVGYGQLEDIYINSPKKMWDNFESQNGYNTYNDFKEALVRASKTHELPSKISSLYLKDVTFFQNPIYLSECGIEISKNIESYIYINPKDAVIKLLDYGKDNIDIWSSDEDLSQRIEDQKLEYAIKLAHDDIGDYKLDLKEIKIANKIMKHSIEDNPVCRFVGDSMLDLYIVKEKDVLIILYYSKNVDIRLLIGQAELYKEYIKKYYKNAYHLYFKTSNNDKEVDNLLNRY